MNHPDLPIPRYVIGDTVFRGTVYETHETLTCPDCLGTRQWRVTTPAGQEHDVQCPRCVDRFSGRDLPPLTVPSWKPSTMQLTIGSIQVDTADHSWNDGCKVRYMCRETGVGSGSVYNENQLFPTEAQALVDAEAKCIASKLERDKDPRVQRAYDYAHTQLVVGTERNYREGLYLSWQSFRRLQGLLEDHKADFSEDFLDSFKFAIDYSKHPLDEVIKAIEVGLATGNLLPLADAARAALLIPEAK